MQLKLICISLPEPVVVVFLQPGSAGGDYYQYDSSNAVNWQIRGKPVVHLKSTVLVLFSWLTWLMLCFLLSSPFRIQGKMLSPAVTEPRVKSLDQWITDKDDVLPVWSSGCAVNSSHTVTPTCEADWLILLALKWKKYLVHQHHWKLWGENVAL